MKYQLHASYLLSPATLKYCVQSQHSIHILYIVKHQNTHESPRKVPGSGMNAYISPLTM